MIINESGHIVAANDQNIVDVSVCEDLLGGNVQACNPGSTGTINIKSRTVFSTKLMLNNGGGSWADVIWRVSTHHNQVDIGGSEVSSLKGLASGGSTHVAGALVGSSHVALRNTHLFPEPSVYISDERFKFGVGH